MTTFDSQGASAQVGDAKFDEVVGPLVPFIYATARKYVSRTSQPVTLWCMDVDEVVQISLFQLWLAYQRTPIDNFKAYARRVVHNEAVNLVRRRKREPVQRLQTGDDGEFYQGNQVHPRSLDEASDPQEVVAQQEYERELLMKVGGVVSKLPTCQKEAMICHLKEKIDNVLVLVDVFSEYDLHIQDMNWPVEKRELQSRKASVSPARRKVIEALKNGTD